MFCSIGGEFLLKMVDRQSGRFPYMVDSDGKTVKTKEGSLLGECYYAMAMAGLANVTQEQKYKVLNKV